MTSVARMMPSEKRVLAPVEVVELRLRHRVVDVDRAEEQAVLARHLLEAVDARRRLLGAADAARRHRRPALRVLADGARNDLVDHRELLVVGARRVREGAVLREVVLGDLALVDEHRHVTAIVDDDVRAEPLAVVGRPRDRAERLLPVLADRHALPRKDGGGRALAGAADGDRGRGVVLRGENVARAPANLGAEVLERLDEDARLDRHVERAHDPDILERLLGGVFVTDGHQPRHFMLGDIDLFATEFGQ